METRVDKHSPNNIASIIGILLVVVLSFGMFCGCSSAAQSGGANDKVSPELSMTKTLVKTVSNDLVLANLGDDAQGGTLVISSEDPAYADFIKDLEDHTGFTIENITINVNVTSSSGAVLGAGGETASQPIYTIQDLNAKVNSQNVSYTEAEGFK